MMIIRKRGRQEDTERFTFYVLLCWLLVAGQAVSAHGTTGTQVLVNEAVGDFWVSLWTSPAVLRVGEGHVTVALAEPPADSGSLEAGAPILGADVVVLVEDITTGVVVEVSATHEAAVNKFLYEGDFMLENAGIHQFTLTINNTASTQFTAEVLPPRLFAWWMVAIPMVVLVLTIMFRAKSHQEKPVRRRR